VERWRLIVDVIRPSDPKLGAFLDHAQVERVEPDQIHLRYEKGTVTESALADKDNQRAVRDAAQKVMGSHPELQMTPTDAPGGGASVFEVDRQSRAIQRQAAVDQARNHPMVQEAVRVLGARVKNIELPES